MESQISYHKKTVTKNKDSYIQNSVIKFYLGSVARSLAPSLSSFEKKLSKC